MNTPYRKPLSTIIKEILLPLHGEAGTHVEVHIKALSDALAADACAILQVSPGKEDTLRILGGFGLRIPLDQWQTQATLSNLSLGATKPSLVQPITLRGPFESNSFLDGEAAETVLFAPAVIGDLCLASIALKRSGDKFSKDDVDRFTAVAGVVNMAQHLKRSLKHHFSEHGTDVLTGLGLFSDFHESMVQELSRARRSSRAVTMGIMSVLPRGPDPEENVLLEVARSLKDKLRNFDTLDRYGSMELAFILPDLRSAEGVRVVDRVMGEIISSLGDTVSSPDVFVGLACYPEDGATVEHLIEMAEAAMSQALEESRPGVYRWKE
jgi:GGDEF domain-containing protein